MCRGGWGVFLIGCLVFIRLSLERGTRKGWERKGGERQEVLGKKGRYARILTACWRRASSLLLSFPLSVRHRQT